MNTRLIIIGVLCVLILAGCKSSSQPNANNSANSSGSANGVTPNPQEARSFLEKGKLLYHDDQDSEAVEAFQQAIKLDPTLAEAHFRLGLSLEALNKADEAEKEYKLAIESYKKYFENEENQKDGEAHYDLAQTYAGLHQYSEAIREYRQAVKTRSEDPDIYYDMGVAHTKLAQYSEAANAFSKSLELDPDNYRAQDALDEAREGMKRIQAGRKHQEDLQKKEKTDDKKAGEGTPTSSPPSSKG
jgi:tetratricopeptide (TPR) repeat protein